MKPKGAEIARFCQRPPAGACGALLYGEDQGLAAERRDGLLAGLLGPNAEADMRLTRLEPATLRADPAALDAALRAQGFFPGPRAVLVVGATDGLAATLQAALVTAARPDAFLLATAEALGPRSSLRALFEGAPNAAALPCYAEAPTARGVAEQLRAAGAAPTPDAADALATLARDMARGEIARLVETLALYRPAAAGALEPADVAALAPEAPGGAIEAALDAVMEGGPAAVRRELARLAAQGAGAVEIALATQRRLRLMHAVACAGPTAAQAALQRVTPPSRRERLAAQAARWGAARIERAMAVIYEADAGLRGGSPAPAAAAIERALLRIAG